MKRMGVSKGQRGLMYLTSGQVPFVLSVKDSGVSDIAYIVHR